MRLVTTPKIIAATVALTFCAGAAFAQSVSVTVNGQPASLNPAPIDRGGRVFVPLRGVFERLGASVVYDAGQINAQGNGRAISLHVGSTSATVNGQSQTLDAAPFIIGASTYVPLRFVAEALGAEVNWDNSNRIVAIAAGGSPPNQTITAQPAPVAAVPAPPAPPERSPLALAQTRPGRDTFVASVRPTIEATFANGTSDPNSIRMRVDGADVTAETTRSPNGVVYSPPSDLLSQRHDVRVAGRDERGRPFELQWTFTSGTTRTLNFINDLLPTTGERVHPTFMVSGRTLPGATIEIDAGATVAVGGIGAFGTDHERIEATADPRGTFSRQVNLNAAPGQLITIVVTSTDPQTKSSVKMTRRYGIAT